MARVLSDETSLTRKRKKLALESSVLGRLWMLWAVLAVLLIAIGLVLHFTRGGTGMIWAGGAMAFLAFGHYYKTQENRKEEQHIEAGLKGEEEVARQLADHLDNSYYIYNDLSVRSGFRSAQMDHLVVSPKGIFLIETKNWSGRIVGREDEKTWMQYRNSGGPGRPLSNPVMQNQRHVNVLEAVLRSGGAPDMAIIPLLVFRSKYATLEIADHRATMLWKAELADYILRYKGAQTYPEATVDAVLARLQRFA